MTRRTPWWLLAALASLGGCDAAGDGADASTPGDGAAVDAAPVVDADGGDVPRSDGGALPDVGPVVVSPSVRIVFPIASSTDADEIHVRVRVEGVEGARAVSIAGVAATLDGGEYVAVVPLALGGNTLTATAARDGDDTLAASVTVERATSADSIARGDTAWGAQRAFGLLADPEGAAAYFGDDIEDGVVRVDLASGDHTWVACTEATSRCAEVGGHGVDIVQPLDVRRAGHRDGLLLVSDGDQLVSVDLSSHDTETLSGRGRGAGPTLGRLSSTIWDSRRDVVVGLDWNEAAVVSIALPSGDRALLSGSGAGSGPDIGAAETLAYDEPRDRALCFRQYVDSLYAVDLGSGDRSVVSGDGVGAGPSLSDPSSLTVDGASAYAWDDDLRGLYAIDLESGDRRLVSSSTRGNGPLAERVELAFGRDVLLARDETTLYAIDPRSGDRVVVSR